MKINIINVCSNHVLVTFKREKEETFSLKKQGGKLETDYSDRIFKFTKGHLIAEARLYNGTFKITNQGLVAGAKTYPWVLDPYYSSGI